MSLYEEDKGPENAFFDSFIEYLLEPPGVNDSVQEDFKTNQILDKICIGDSWLEDLKFQCLYIFEEKKHRSNPLL